MSSINSTINTIQLIVLIACTIFIGFGTPALAATTNYNFPLEADQEAPPAASTGTGVCNATLDTVSGAFAVNCTFSNLGTNACVSHIHGLAGPGVNAGVILGLTATAATSGTITGNGILTAPQVTGMINGQTYLNLHTQGIPGGELRGQVVNRTAIPVPIPVPAAPTWALIAMVLLLLVFGTIAERRQATTNKKPRI
jgi:hypothetical protein